MNTFLSKYRSTPHATTGLTPTELFLGRKVRTKLDLLKPKIAEAVENKQLEQKKHHDRHSKLRSFSDGRTVSVRDYLSSKKWVSGVVTSILGPTMYKVKLPNGSLVVRHVDQLRDRLPADTNPQQDDQFKFFTADSTDDSAEAPVPPNNSPPRRIYPRRNRRPVERLMNFHI